jgi:hypothetical protein
MHNFLDLLFDIALFCLVRSADIAIGGAVARNYLQAIIYGLVALALLVTIVLRLF